MTDNIVKRLRDAAEDGNRDGPMWPFDDLDPPNETLASRLNAAALTIRKQVATIEAQAAEIARLTKERDEAVGAAEAKVEKLREALKPFVQFYESAPDKMVDTAWGFKNEGSSVITAEQFAVARAAYEETGP